MPKRPQALLYWLALFPGPLGFAFTELMKADLVDKAAQIIKDPPILINMVSKRVRQLNMGRPALVERRPGMREADIALQEIIEGKIKVEMLDEQGAA